MWSNNYSQLINRNIGILSESQQILLKNSKVAIAGLGGIGGPIAEMLCRLGIEQFNILDNGSFEATNSNRQNFSFTTTTEKLKTEVTADFLKNINPEVKIRKYFTVNDENIHEFLDSVDCIVLGIDSVKPCLHISREAFKKNIPLVEGWAVLFGNVRVFTGQTPTLEQVYEMDTLGKSIEGITEQEEKNLLIHSLNIVSRQIPGLLEYYPPEVMERMEKKNEGSTLGPAVWLTCSLMAIEVMKLLLNWGKPALAPNFICYNPFTHQIPKPL